MAGELEKEPELMVQERKLGMEGEVQEQKANNMEREMSSRKGARDVIKVKLGSKFGASGRRKMGGRGVSVGKEINEGGAGRAVWS